MNGPSFTISSEPLFALSVANDFSSPLVEFSAELEASADELHEVIHSILPELL